MSEPPSGAYDSSYRIVGFMTAVVGPAPSVGGSDARPLKGMCT